MKRGHAARPYRGVERQSLYEESHRFWWLKRGTGAATPYKDTFRGRSALCEAIAEFLTLFPDGQVSIDQG
jgi:hypothetical protein